jgi:hypothetical protein
MRNPAGPVSTSPERFMVKFGSLLVLSGLASGTSLIRILSKRNLEVVFSWKKFFQWCALFLEKKLNSLSVAPRASCYLKQKVGESWVFRAKKTKKSFLRICTLQPPNLYMGSFFTQRTWTEGPFVIFSGSLSEVGGSWPLCGECSAVTGCRCFTTDSLSRGTSESCSGFGVCRTRRLTQTTVDFYWFRPSWSSNSIYVQSALAFALDWLLWSCSFLSFGVPIASLLYR